MEIGVWIEGKEGRPRDCCCALVVVVGGECVCVFVVFLVVAVFVVGVCGIDDAGN